MGEVRQNLPRDIDLYRVFKTDAELVAGLTYPGNYAAADLLASVATEAIVFRICDAIW